MERPRELRDEWREAIVESLAPCLPEGEEITFVSPRTSVGPKPVILMMTSVGSELPRRARQEVGARALICEHHDLYRFYNALCTTDAHRLAVIVVDDSVPPLAFATLLGHLQLRTGLTDVEVIYRSQNGVVSVFREARRLSAAGVRPQCGTDEVVCQMRYSLETFLAPSLAVVPIGARPALA